MIRNKLLRTFLALMAGISLTVGAVPVAYAAEVPEADKLSEAQMEEAAVDEEAVEEFEEDVMLEEGTLIMSTTSSTPQVTSSAYTIWQAPNAYTVVNPFIFPKSTEGSVYLEPERATLKNYNGANEQYTMMVQTADWASGQFIRSFDHGDVIEIPYRADVAGTYRVFVLYRSGSAANALSWSDTAGNINPGTVNVSHTDSNETKSAMFNITIPEGRHGSGYWVFTAPAGNSPQIDRFEITLMTPTSYKERPAYTQEDPFLFPREVGEVRTLEAEDGLLTNSEPDGHENWPLQVVRESWASGGRFLDSLNKNDTVRFYYKADAAGTYEVTATYRSGQESNKLSWSDELGSIQLGEVSTGHTDNKVTQTKVFNITNTQYGTGLWKFTGPDGWSPQIDKFDIKLVSRTDLRPITYCTVTFVLDNGERDVTLQVEKNTSIGSETFPINPIKEGFDFKGWNESADGMGREFTSSTVITGDMTVYARWTEAEDTSLGDVLPEDVPADGVIPRGIWVAGVKDMLYTGAKHIQSFRVYDYKKLLREKVDYTVTHKNNVKGYEYSEDDFTRFEEAWKTNPKTTAYGGFEVKKAPQLLLKMKGNYTKNVSVFYQIIKPDISDEDMFTIDDLSVTYTGKKQTPAPVILWKLTGKNLKNNVDFQVDEYIANKASKTAFANHTEEGYDLTITAKGNFKGTKKIKLFVSKDAQEIAMSKVTVKTVKSVAFNGQEQEPALTTVKYKKTELVKDQDYEIVGYYDNRDVGTASVVIQGIEKPDGGTSYIGTKRVTFKITGNPMNKVKFDGLSKSYEYTGEDIKPMEQENEGTEKVLKNSFYKSKASKVKLLNSL